MKFVFVEKFDDLEKANQYVAKLNEAFKKLQESSDDYEKKIEILTKEISESRASIESLNHQLDIANAIVVDLRKQLEVASDSTLKTEIESLNDQLEAANEIIADLGKQLEAQSALLPDNRRIVSIGEKRYYLEGTEMIIPGHGPISAEALAQDETLLQNLLDRESSLLVPVDQE